MAVINANCLAIYYDSDNSQNKTAVLFPYSDTASAATAADVDYSAAIVADEDATSGEVNIFRGYGSIVHSTDTFTATDLTLAGAATSTNLELTNSVENVARDGEGGTLQESTQDWSLTADGLIQVSPDAGVDLMDIARNKYYVFVKFSIDKNGTKVDYVGQALIESVSLSGGVDEIATYSVSLTGVDALYKAA